MKTLSSWRWDLFIGLIAIAVAIFLGIFVPAVYLARGVENSVKSSLNSALKSLPTRTDLYASLQIWSAKRAGEEITVKDWVEAYNFAREIEKILMSPVGKPK